MATTEKPAKPEYGPSAAKIASDEAVLEAASGPSLAEINAGLAASLQNQQAITQMKTDALNGLEVAALQKLAAEANAAVAAATTAPETTKTETTPATGGTGTTDAPKLTAKTASGEEKELEAMTRAELEEVATAEKVDVAFAKNKGEVLEAVKAALLAKAAPAAQ